MRLLRSAEPASASKWMLRGMSGHSSDRVAEEIVREHRRLIPNPYGEADGARGAGEVAAPLFAGFSLTFALLVLQDAERLRWPNVVLLLAVIAASALVMSVQAAQWARSFCVTPWDAARWWPDASASEKGFLRKELIEHDRSYVAWRGRQTRSFHLGVVALLSALTVALVPPPAPPDGSIPGLRWVVVVVAAVGVAAELAWVVVPWIANRSLGPRLRGIRYRAVLAARWVARMPVE